ncbi:MAG: DUF72 domain-containing protein [Gemmatimonadales bacterium]
MRAYVGTSGWSYKEWKGSFYPSDLSADQMLRYYAGRFPSVEVNNSFYRVPSERVLMQWAEQTPPEFRFVLKASRRITHINRLTAADDSLDYFLRIANVLGERRGPTLFQLPPSLKKDLPRLQEFLGRLPRTWSAAMEFRHASWFVDDVYEALRSHEVALVAVDEDEEEGPGSPLVPTASWGYVRMRRGEYTEAALDSWARRIGEQRWQEAYVFVKHEDGKQSGPDAAGEMLKVMLGYSTT